MPHREGFWPKPVSVDYKKCGRCGADIHAPDPPHLCEDIAKRLARREKQIEAVMGFLDRYEVDSVRRRVAELIVEKLANMGVEQD